MPHGPASRAVVVPDSEGTVTFWLVLAILCFMGGILGFIAGRHFNNELVRYTKDKLKSNTGTGDERFGRGE